MREFAVALTVDGQYAGIIREGKGGDVVVLDMQGELPEQAKLAAGEGAEASGSPHGASLELPKQNPVPGSVEELTPEPSPPRKRLPGALFLGHGTNKKPLEELKELLRQYGVAFKVAAEEANLARPISVKVRETMQECSAAVLIFTADRCYFDADANEIWRPSENVVHELGAASFAYEDRVVIFKETGISLPTNFSDVGYIEFEKDNLAAKGGDLFKELLGLGIVKVSVAGAASSR